MYESNNWIINSVCVLMRFENCCFWMNWWNEKYKKKLYKREILLYERIHCPCLRIYFWNKIYPHTHMLERNKFRKWSSINSIMFVCIDTHTYTQPIDQVYINLLIYLNCWCNYKSPIEIKFNKQSVLISWREKNSLIYFYFILFFFIHMYFRCTYNTNIVRFFEKKKIITYLILISKERI